MSEEQADLLRRLDAAIARLEVVVPQTPTTEHSIAQLRAKRSLVESGNYVVRQVNEEACAVVGRMICILVKANWKTGYMRRESE